MAQRVKTEQWQVKELISKIENKTIRKEGFQRKKKWIVLPSCENTKASTERRYIEFLYTTQNSVLPITLATDPLNPTSYSNIDGNNRINAISHYMDTPFDLFEEYLEPLYRFIDNIQLSIDDTVSLKGIFKKISYIDIINFKYKQYFVKIKQD